MNVWEETIAKINQLPEALVSEVNDFVSFLLMKYDQERWQLWELFVEGKNYLLLISNALA